MPGEIPRRCPACGRDLRVCLLRCSACETEVQGDFSLGRIAQLSDEQLSFLEIFIRCRGSLKDAGAQIGISYPTARNRLDDLIRAMGFADPQAETNRRMEILTRLKDGELTAEQALQLLQGGKGNE